LGVAITPDGKTGYVAAFATSSITGRGGVTSIDTTNNTAGTFIFVGQDPQQVAVTPDQGPVAVFSATAAPVGQPLTFDASGSSDPDGTVASYRWNFGDGSSQTTSSPTVTHTYMSTSTSRVTLTVTDDAGCSTPQTFTGQTVSCQGPPAARALIS
jgi:large repetitive protein